MKSTLVQEVSCTCVLNVDDIISFYNTCTMSSRGTLWDPEEVHCCALYLMHIITNKKNKNMVRRCVLHVSLWWRKMNENAPVFDRIQRVWNQTNVAAPGTIALQIAANVPGVKTTLVAFLVRTRRQSFARLLNMKRRQRQSCNGTSVSAALSQECQKFACTHHKPAQIHQKVSRPQF